MKYENKLLGQDADDPIRFDAKASYPYQQSNLALK